MGILVISPGLQTTVQDTGRFGFRHDGVVTSGAMDEFALRTANLLVGNDEHEAGLEITLHGPVLRGLNDHWIAICGADLRAEIDGKPVPLWRPVFMRKESLLTFRYAKSGCRAYVAIRGGIALPTVLNSKSTHVHAGIGGLNGRALQAGDQLDINRIDHADQSNVAKSKMPFEAASWSISWEQLPEYSNQPVVRVMRSSEFHRFTKASQHALFEQTFTVKPQSDRMGIQLTGPALQLQMPDADRISSAVTMGTVQVPPSSEPIILMADGQTVGGYPVIAFVASVDLPLLAQLKPNDQVRFVEISHREAEDLYEQREREFIMLAKVLKIRGVPVN